MTQPPSLPSPSSETFAPPVHEAERLRDLTPIQWRAGAAAWLGWLFDGLDSYLYVLVAAVFVGELMHLSPTSPDVKLHSAWIQAAFLVGWALGGAVFGRLGDRFGRSRTISITILIYALCTGLAFFAHTWWHLLIFRFLAALGIGGEWAAGSSLISETWPRKWRPWVSSVLQSAYQGGILLASLAAFLLRGNPRTVFLVGALPALLVFWIRRAIPEPEEWHQAQRRTAANAPGVADLFRGETLRTTLLTLLVCSVALTGTWAFLFWFPQHLRSLPDIASWSAEAKTGFITKATAWAMLVAVGGNFFANVLARRFGYRLGTALMFSGSLITLYLAYHVPREASATVIASLPAHFFVQGIFGLFPMYVPALFPTLLRTTGAGLCYNFGRLVAAFGTVALTQYVKNLDVRVALMNLSFIFIPGIAIALLMPEPVRDVPPPGSHALAEMDREAGRAGSA